ncbi:MarR family transcriptional regulator [Nocardia sp. NBC_00508]|uniref:MarR family winged helix-turn-helix transcriptional regulator n=1 Tax=Nocardia sp. NBC_00508 TaxID=2975992 RepID=UPI002E802C77|nr:MarR family transcriptional regulator [Nocardia sp. NBC_00508]WUD64535.1 MarR family transcriptional regulator [Nocardia sp. NBC_00508]
MQFVLLASLVYLAAGRDDPVRQRDLAEHAATDPMMTSQVLRVLAQKGLIERRDHPSDRRAKALAVTEAGAALANRAIVAVEACDEEFFAPLGRQGAAFARSLRLLRDRNH